MTSALRVLMHVEMRPVPQGEWTYDGDVATYEGDVEITLRHPNVRSPLGAYVFVVPMIYVMHVPPAYSFRHSPTFPSTFGTYHVGLTRRRSRSPSSSDRVRVVRTVSPVRRTPIRRSPPPPIYTPGEGIPEDDEEEEDPREDD